MGTGEEKTASKSSKPASSTQEVVVPSTPYSDWSNSMQAYPNPYFSSPVASPSPHPYMWGAQHHMMPPYGTPVPYPTMYHPGGVYAHPNMPMPLASAPGNTETVKDQASTKKSKEGVKRKRDVAEKSASGSGNNGGSQSDGTGSGTNSSSDENGNRQENGSSKKGSFDQMLADGNSQSKVTSVVEGSVPMRPVAQGTNLNIGMHLWSPSGATAATTRPNTSIAIIPGPEQWMDDREIKRQKRKQSNRESAKRSRLRKQAECEQLQERVEGLTNENQELREELKKLSENFEKLKEENSSIKDQLVKACGSKAVVLVDNVEHSTGESKE